MERVVLKEIKYGVLPPGFEIKVPSSDLTQGHEYKIGVRGWGASGELEFVLDKGSI
jgi:hypothetical protein